MNKEGAGEWGGPGEQGGPIKSQDGEAIKLAKFADGGSLDGVTTVLESQVASLCWRCFFFCVGEAYGDGDTAGDALTTSRIRILILLNSQDNVICVKMLPCPFSSHRSELHSQMTPWWIQRYMCLFVAYKRTTLMVHGTNIEKCICRVFFFIFYL